VVSHTPLLQATMHVVTVSVCVPFGVNNTQPFTTGLSEPIVLGVNEHKLYVLIPPGVKSSAVAQIGSVGQVGQAGLTVTVSGTGGGKMMIYVVSHTPFLHATMHVVTVSVCIPFGVNTMQPLVLTALILPMVVGTKPHVL
jgi:hypothetical protein